MCKLKATRQQRHVAFNGEKETGAVQTYLLPCSEALRARLLIGFEVFGKGHINKKIPLKQALASVGQNQLGLLAGLEVSDKEHIDIFPVESAVTSGTDAVCL